jgi:hydrogenase nickel incorporation protein HypA/HybF
MHELAIMKEVLAIVLDFGNMQQASCVKKITLLTGELFSIEPKWAQLFYRMVAKGTFAEEAELEFVTAPIILKCRDCGLEMESKAYAQKTCNCCGGTCMELVSGRQFRIESVEIIQKSQ